MSGGVGEDGSGTRPRAAARRRTPRSWAALGAAVVVVVGVGVLAGWVGSRGAAGGGGGAVPAAGSGAGSCDAAAVAQSVLPSVVTIEVGSGDGGSGGGGSGSGEVIDASGIVLTNDHVIASGADGPVTVRLDDGTELDARVIGRDPRTDLAVLRADTDRRLPALAWGGSDALDVGEPVVALGAPLGLSGTVTTGVVSALGRDVPVPTGDGSGSTVLTGAIQTDASINPGNSGGALVDCSGRLVGINTAIATVPSATGASSGSVGIGFAVPSVVARPIAEALRTDGSVAHPVLGVTTLPVALHHADGSVAVGLQLTAVTDGGPADDAGLRPGDVLTAVRGLDALHPDSVAFLEATRSVGDDVRVTYLRDGEQHDATITLRAAPSS
ncbi:S1C family serine protease [Curtobacterium pusillum]|uniref:S1C family serine protease n=1 Tax=Curtobacterium pusillum TaxID=69373 RepID=UPI0011A0A507|nr:trypsin-like peptidase domain-containing protein [Curtobacterium pusillum]